MASSATLSPNAMARDLTRSLKRDVTAKAVRTVARDVLARFDKTKHPEYQAHAYTPAEQRTLREAFAARGSRSKAQPSRKPSKAQRKVGPRQTRTAPSAEAE